MLNTIKISVEKPILTKPGVTHVSTSYQISTTPSFNVNKNLLLNVFKDTVNILEYVFKHKITQNTPLYLRTRTHNSDGTSSVWATTTEIKIVYPIPTYVNTRPKAPVVNISIDYINKPTGEIVIGVDGILPVSRTGSTYGITWILKTTNGDTLYKKIYSLDLTPQLRLPLDIMVSDIIVCDVILHNDTGVDSNIGQGVHVISKRISPMFTATIHDRLYSASVNHLSISQHDKLYTSADIQLFTLSGRLLLNLSGLNPYTPGFKTPVLNKNTYIVKTRLCVGTTKTPWVECYIGDAYIRDVRSYNPAIPYESMKSYFNTNNKLVNSHQTTTTDEDGVFYMLKPGTNILYSYMDMGGVVYPGSSQFTLPGNVVTKDSVINILKLHSGRLLVDVTIDIGNKIVSAFYILGYNNITKKLNHIRSHIRHDEPISTGMCGSAVVRNNDLIYYIPGKITDTTGNSLDLELRIFNINTNKVISKIPLPVSGIKENVTMTTDINGNIYIFGGTGVSRKDSLGITQAHLLNTDIYMLTKNATSWTHVGMVSVDSSSSHRYRMRTLENGNFLLINTTPTNNTMSVNKEYLFNPVTKSELPLPVKYINDVATVNGSDISITSGSPNRYINVLHALDPVSLIPPVGKIMPLNPNVKDLIIPVGKIMYVRDVGVYNSITINGSNMSNSGVLVYIRNGVPEKYYYNDLIVTKDMSIPANSMYNNVIVLNGSTVTTL